jgi:hypothetical protein
MGSQPLVVLGQLCRPAGRKPATKAETGRRDVMSEVPRTMPPRKAPRKLPRARTKTNTGGQVENTKVIEKTLVKELGKMVP